jgi:hypothetical protein
MKSKLLSTVDTHDESFRTHCGVLFKIKNLAAFLPVFEKIEKSSDFEDQMRIASDVAAGLSVDPQEVYGLFNLARYIGLKFLDPANASERPEDVAADLLVLGKAPETRLGDTIEFVASVKSYMNRERPRIRAREFGGFVVPGLHDFSGVIDVRAVFDRDASFSKSAPYQASFLGVVPSVILRFETTSQSNDVIVIQLTEEELGRLIEKLTNLGKELVATKSSLNLKS